MFELDFNEDFPRFVDIPVSLWFGAPCFGRVRVTIVCVGACMRNTITERHVFSAIVSNSIHKQTLRFSLSLADAVCV